MTDKLKTVQELLSLIQLNLKVGKDQVNNFGKYKYRNAEDILEAVKREINKLSDVISMWPNYSVKTPVVPVVVGNRFFIRCTAILKAGNETEEADGYAELDTHKKGMDLAQLTGAATSYAKKYALGNLFAIDDSKDDPDSKDNTKSGKPVNKSGLSSNGPLAESEDMKEQVEAKRLISLKEALKGFGSAAEIDGYLEYKYQGRTRLEILGSMKEVNAAEAKALIKSAKLELGEDEPT